MLYNLSSSRTVNGNGLSIQSCFPEMRSVTNSSCVSIAEDDSSTRGLCSDDDLSLKEYAFGPGVIYGDGDVYHSSYNVSSYTHNTHLQHPSSSLDFKEANGRDVDVALDPSIWPLHTSNQAPFTAVEMVAEGVDDDISSARAAAPQPEAVSSMLSPRLYTFSY